MVADQVAPVAHLNERDTTLAFVSRAWEDSPAGYPQTPPYEWWIWHDEPSRGDG
jgi:predicted dithiol-disulfide oxidoreductase (DUF899 family)